MARVAEAEGDLGRAEAELRMVLRSEPQNRVCRVTLARILIERGGLAEARQHLEHALFLSPGDSVARELLAQTNAAPALPRTAESVPVEGAPTASGPPSSLLEQALDLLAGTEGVLAVVLVDRSGLLVDSRCTENEDAEAASAMAHETWTLARNYMVRMRLGMLRLVTLHAGGRMFVLAPCNVGLLVVAAEPAARAGLLHMRAEASRNLLVNA
jgi:predicted regulator of Ras-like GTPase activity (Roadblock/LC7/MglB family)